jgi:hypothetical protein
VGTFTPNPALGTIVATKFGVPAVDRLKNAVRREGQRRAPDGKVWVTARDERVRDSHIATDGQLVPDNLRYILPKSGHGTLAAGRDLARAPRDASLPIGNRINCRCASVSVPGAIARTIHTTPTIVVGSRAEARVVVDFPRVVESEFPDQPDRGGGWLRAAVDEVAARSKGQARRT